MRRPRLLVLTGLGAWLAVGLGLWACGDRTGPAPEEGPGDTAAVAQREWEAFYRPPTDRIPVQYASNPGTPWGDYVGSTACKDCHPKAYTGWRNSFHSRTLYDARQETVFGDFSGKVTFENPKWAFHVFPFTRDGRYFFRIVRNESFKAADKDDPNATAEDLAMRQMDTYGNGVPPFPTGEYEVLYSFGNRRHQPYVVRAHDGRHWVPPVYWNDVSGAWEWDGWRPYVVSCGNCHVTGIKTTLSPGERMDGINNTSPQRWNLSPEKEGWAEGAVGCEVCHGAGKPHVDTVNRMGEEPYRQYLAAGGAPTIYNPAKDTPQRRMQQCDLCHSFTNESSVSWQPHPSGYDHDPQSKRLSPGGKKDQAQFYKNGVDMSPCTVGWVFRESKMGKAGVECQACHDPHGNDSWAELVRPVEHNELCLHCHVADKSGHFADEVAVAAHAHHKLGSPGVLCIECHMPRDKRFTNGIHVMSAKIHGHELSIPTGHEADREGPTCSCNVCHSDRSAAWVVRTLEKWRAAPQAPPKPPK